MLYNSADKSQRPLILASSSPRRQELIRSLNLPVIVRPSDADEDVPDGMAPETIVETLSLRKAYAVHAQPSVAEEKGIIIGSDTIVVSAGRVLGKPRDEAEAIEMLTMLQGTAHEVYTGLACLDMSAGHNLSDDGLDQLPELSIGETGRYRVKTGKAVGYTVSRVTFRPMSQRELEAYVATGEPMDKAGAYGVQGIGSIFIERIEGDFYSVMGLPLNLLYAMLLELGVSPFEASI